MNEALIKIVFKNLGIDGEALKAQAATGFEIIKQTAARMQRIEQSLMLIAEKLNITLPPQENANGHAAEQNAVIFERTAKPH